MFKYQRIMVPLDGSELAERALAPAITIAQAMDASLVLFRAVPLMAELTGSDQTDIEKAGGTETDYLRSVLGQAASVGVEGCTQLSIWQPAAEAIIACAKESEADLIVMSSHGRSGRSRWVFGSVAEKVLRRAPCHVMVIRAQAETDPFTRQRILVPLDGSPLAEEALPPAVSLAAATDAELLLLRVIESGKAAIARVDRKVLYGNIEIRGREKAEPYLQNVRDSLAEHYSSVKMAVVAGPVAETIVDYAEEPQAGLIVMSSHGRSGLSRWLYGSIAEKVLHGAGCATLVIPMKNRASASPTISK